MRLTIINQFYTPDISPTAHLSASLAEHRAGLGDEVTVIASRGGYVAKGDATDRRQGRVRVHRVWTPRAGKGSIFKRLLDYGAFYVGAAWRAVRLPRQDVVVCLTTPPFIVLTGLLHRVLHRRVKLVLWNMDCYPEVAERTGVIKPGGVLASVQRWLHRRVFKRLDHLLVLDPAMGELLAPYFPGGKAPAGGVTEVPNWERGDLFPTGATHAVHPLIEDLGLGGRFVVLYLGNAGYGHRFDTVIEAAARYQASGEAVSFLFVGGGRRIAELEAAKAEQGLENVVLEGYIPKEQTPSLMATVLGSAGQPTDSIRGLRAGAGRAGGGCALITLSDESLGVMSPSKLHAHLGMGMPVLYVGPGGSNVDMAVERYGCGVSLRHGDVEGLMAFVDRLRGDAAERAARAAAARGAFESAYQDGVTLPRIDAVLEELLAVRA